MKIVDFISYLKTEEKEIEENKKRQSLFRAKIREDFKNKYEDFRLKTTKSIVEIALNSNGDFTFEEIQPEPVYHNAEEEEAEKEFIRCKEYKYEFDEKEELIFNFFIKTIKSTQSYRLTVHFFNSDDNFSVHTELTKVYGDYKTAEKFTSFANYMSADFEENLVSLLKEVK